MEDKNIFSVFGGRGFIGKYVCNSEDFISNEDGWDDKNKFISKTNKLVYLISTTHNYNVLDNDPYTDIKTNLIHLMTVLQANKMKYGNGGFEITFISSWFVYGKTEICPVSEYAECNPTGFYSITKFTAEKLLVSYCDTFGIKWKIVRLSNVMGVGDSKISKRKNALQYMIKELCLGNTVDLYKGEIYRDYIHVLDAAKGIRKVVREGRYEEVYNIGSGVGTVIKEIVQYVHNQVGGNINIVEVPEFHKQVQVEKMWLDVHKIKKHIGWEPTFTVKDIVDELIAHYRER